MPIHAKRLNQQQINRLENFCPREDGKEITVGGLIYNENVLLNETTDSITANELQKFGWTLGNITHGVVCTGPDWTIGKIQLQLYNQRKMYKKPKGKGSAEEKTM